MPNHNSVVNDPLPQAHNQVLLVVQSLNDEPGEVELILK